MNKYFNIPVAMTTQHKTKKLIKGLGVDSFYNLIQLWSFTAENKPTGELLNMDSKDIEIVSGWEGNAKIFVKTLIELKFLGEVDGIYSVCGWRDFNPFPKWPTPGKRPNTKTWNKIKKEVFERDNYICKYCGQKIDLPECDHIMPICRGGSNNPNNLATACSICNKSKGSKLLEEWII